MDEEVQKLILELEDGNMCVRMGAALALGKIAEKHPEYDWGLVIPALIVALGDEYFFARKNATDALGEIGLPAVPALIPALGDGNLIVRWNAAQALGKIAERHPEYYWSGVVPALIVTLGDGNSGVRKGAAEALGKIAERHPKYNWSGAVPALIVALGDGDLNVSESAARVLGKIGLPAVPALILALGDGNSNSRRYAAWALGNIAPRDYNDLNALIPIARKLKSENKDFKPVMKLYSKWVKALNERADRGFAEKRFHVPKVEKPDNVERVLKFRRLGA